ncbi:glycoside hydrolase family 130 protein [Mycobacteroides sp. LB1]|uniref:glycoside hydrolase family 130 protein n=1 Tax=Mycobacteroides sp. LB1 TaxID=2750814 RepID=UPI0015E00E9A|nr:glycosidase-like protein [Mycobacteroides sp. LB1]
MTSHATTALDESVRRGSQVLYPDASRVLTKLFLPGQEIRAQGISRADVIIDRVLRLTPEEAQTTLADIVSRFRERHRELDATFAAHFALVKHRLPQTASLTHERQQLIGACFTQEYAIEAAALLNPSMVAHPDQSGLEADECRFIMSLRAIGEGHVSSVEFRTGVLAPNDSVRIDAPGHFADAGRYSPAALSRNFLHAALAERGDAEAATHVLSLLPEEFDSAALGEALASVGRDRLTRGSTDAIIEHIRWIASCSYRLTFPPDRPVSERVIFPTSPDGSHGVEDARFTQFRDDDGTVSYYATYTAFDGSKVGPRLLHTRDFVTFDSTQLTGPAAKDKGMALFPRRVHGAYLMLSRWDRESISLVSSPDALVWSDPVTIYSPSRPWELIQLGNCGPPIETADGWLVLTHGVGPMRTYGIGAILLDLDDPATVVGALREPLLVPNETERDGYVPNVVYSCGALVHRDTLVLPYGCSDSAVRFAFVHLPALLESLRA